MPASCPFCGATLNFGLKFCVVCGRHTTQTEISKLSGLKGGIRQADVTRRLDDAMSASDFEKTRTKPGRLTGHIRSLGEQFFYVLIGLTLFFCAVRFTLSTYFPGKVHQVLAPILGKNSSSAIEQGLTGVAPPEAEEETEPEEKETTPAKPGKPVKSVKSVKPVKTIKSAKSAKAEATETVQAAPKKASVKKGKPKQKSRWKRRYRHARRHHT